MEPFDEINDFALLSEEMHQTFKASYFTNKYYFSVNSGKPRATFGIDHAGPLEAESQIKLHYENFIPLFHEFIHYIHEISTVIGNVGLGLDLYMKSIFSHYFGASLGSSLHLGVNITIPDKFDQYRKVSETIRAIQGSHEVGQSITAINNVSIGRKSCYLMDAAGLIPFDFEVPILNVTVYDGGKPIRSQIEFGKFHLYEGLAYELDREREKTLYGKHRIVDNQLNSEYTVLRLLAKYYCPDITRRTFLTLASLSLSYLDAGQLFVNLLQEYNNAMANKEDEMVFLKREKDEVSALLTSKMIHFEGAQEEIIDVFEGRDQLEVAFKAVTEHAVNGYRVRAANPAFEVDLVFDNRADELFRLIPICDYIYTFTDADDFDRDIIGTSSFDEATSKALKVLIAYDHYQKSHRMFSTEVLERTPIAHFAAACKCPFYSCCNLHLRKDYQELCRTKPWRLFEHSFATDKMYCWYGQAVGSFKAVVADQAPD